MTTTVRAALLALALSSGCSLPEAPPEEVPHGGISKEPRELAEILNYSMVQNYYGTVFKHCSAQTREKVGTFSFKSWLNELTLPAEAGGPLAGLPVKDLLRNGRYFALYAGNRDRDREQFLILAFPPGKPEERHARLLCVRETEEGPQKGDWRLALDEQLERREAWSLETPK